MSDFKIVSVLNPLVQFGVPAISAGTQSATSGTVIFSNLNGVTFGMDAGTITASVAAAGGSVNLSAGTTSNNLTNFVFSNSNGVSFGLNGSTVTATVQTNYLTTAMASNRGSDFVQANAAFAGTNASGTIASNGISVSVGNYITTAMLSNAVTLSNIRLSAGTTSNLASAFTFGNANGISFGLNAGTITGSHNAITTGRASNDGVGLATAQTNVTWTVNSAGISLNAGGYLTTAMLSNAATISNIRVSAGTTSNNLSAITFDNAGGVSFGLNGSVITAEAPAGAPSPVNFSAGTTSNNLASVIFANGNGVSFGLNTGASSQSITASHNGITTGRASNDGVGLATAQTNVTWTVNSAGLSFNAGGYAGTTTGFAGANISMSMTHNSVGLNISASVAAPGGGAGATLSGFDGFANNEFLAIAGGNASLWIDRLDMPCAMQFDRLGLRITHSNATNSSGSATISVWAAFYTRNASSLSLLHSTSFSTGITQSGTVGSYSRYAGIKILPIPWTTTIDPGNYWLGLVSRTTTGGANMTFGNLANSQLASTMSGFFGSGSAATNGIRLGVGVYSVTTAGLPSAISITQINGNSSAFLRQPAYLFMSDIF